MAFTINTEPADWSPSFNHLTYKVTSTNSTQPVMKYIFDLYVNGTLVNTSKLFPRPDGTCLFDPSTIIQQYMEATMRNEITTLTTSDLGEVCYYYIVFKEEYYVSNVLTTYTRATGDTKYSYYSVADWENAKDLDTFVTGFMPNIASTGITDAAKFLGPNKYAYKTMTPGNTYPYPEEFYKIKDNEKRVLSLFVRNQDRDYFSQRLWVYTFPKAGFGNKFFYKDYTFSTNSNPTFAMRHLPVGINELNAISWDVAFAPVGSTASITSTEDAYYIIWFNNNTEGKETHRPIGFAIDNCSKYEHYTVYYQSPKGGWWYINMDLKNQKEEKIKTVSMKNVLPYNYGNSDKVIKPINRDVAGGYVLTSDWLKNQSDSDDIMDMIKSPNIYLINDTGEYIPVLIDDATYVTKNIAQDKMVNYTISFTEAFNKNVII